jgi:hypothetical protein
MGPSLPLSILALDLSWFLGRAMYVMMRKANNDEERVSVKDNGGRRRRGGSGCAESSHLHR